MTVKAVQQECSVRAHRHKGFPLEDGPPRLAVSCCWPEPIPIKPVRVWQSTATSSGRSIRYKFLRGAAAGYDGWVLVMLPEQKKLQRDIHSLTEVIKRTWAEVASKPMRPKDRRELRGHIGGLITELVRLLGLLE
jgi:hypothetical protein